MVLMYLGVDGVFTLVVAIFLAIFRSWLVASKGSREIPSRSLFLNAKISWNDIEIFYHKVFR